MVSRRTWSAVALLARAHPFRCRAQAAKLITDAIRSNAVCVFSKSYCPYCEKAKKALVSVGATFEVFELDEYDRLTGDTCGACAAVFTRRSCSGTFGCCVGLSNALVSRCGRGAGAPTVTRFRLSSRR